MNTCNTAATRSPNAHTHTATTLRERIHTLAKGLPAQTSSDIAAQQRLYMAQVQQTAAAVTERIKQHEARQSLTASILQQAKNNLATANTIARTNARLGSALKSLAMCDINTLRGNTASPLQLITLAEYHNLGTFWDAGSRA